VLVKKLSNVFKFNFMQVRRNNKRFFSQTYINGCTKYSTLMT